MASKTSKENKMKLNRTYILLSVLIFVLEIFIERTTGFVRYTLGDVFAVMFVYTSIKSVFDVSVIKAAIIALSIAFTIEIVQLFNLHVYYPKNYKRLFKLLLGSSFSMGDMLAYTSGILIVLIIEWRLWNLIGYNNINNE